MKRLLVLSHCILNTASKVVMDEKDLADEYKMKRRLLERMVKNDIEMLQLPCPEFILYGAGRWGHVREQFMHPHYREECIRMLRPVLQQLEEYLSYPDRFQVLGIVSVEGSPSCGYHMTCSGQWGGEISRDAREILEMQDTCKCVDEPGVFMKILERELRERKIDLSILSMEEAVRLLDSVNEE